MLLPFGLKAQVAINVQMPPAGLIQKEQLWNLVVTNSGSTTIEAAIALNLQDAQTGQSVLTAATNTILLSRGVKVLTVSDVYPVQYNAATAFLNGNFLPLGSYIACYSVIKRTREVVEKLADECVRIAVNPLSPPLLNTPADKAVLPVSPSAFSWIPPAPKDMFQDLSYDLALTEVMPGQSPSEAMLSNQPFYVKSHTRALFDIYPSSNTNLQKGKTYAWQVTARNGQNYAASTEVWSFTLAPDVIEQPLTAAYIELKRRDEISGVHALSTDTLKIKYYSFGKDHEALVRFVYPDGRLVQEKKQTIRYGDNYLLFPLSNRFHADGVYRVEIADADRNISAATFTIKQPN